MKREMSTIRSHLVTINRMAGEYPIEILACNVIFTALYILGSLFWLSAQFVYRASDLSQHIDALFKAVEVAVNPLLTFSAEIRIFGGIHVQSHELGELFQTMQGEIVLVGIWLLCSAILAGRIAIALWRVAELFLQRRGLDWLERQMLSPSSLKDENTLNVWVLAITNRPPFIGIKKCQGMDIVGFLSEYLPKLRQVTWPRPRMTNRALVDTVFTVLIVPATTALLASATPIITMLMMFLAIVYLPRLRRFTEEVASSWR